jgi:hypothetical protein
MEHRITTLENIVEKHTGQIDTLFAKVDDVKIQLHAIQNTLNQIRWMFFGALGWYALTEFGIMTALKVIA